MKRCRTGVDLAHPPPQPPPPSLVPPLHIFLQDEPALERLLYGPFAKTCATKKACARASVCLRTLLAPSRLAPPSCHPPFTSHSIHIKGTPRKLGPHCCCGPAFPLMCSLVSLPAPIDGCPVSLSRRFRKHQPLSDEVLTKGHRVAATEGKGADYREGGSRGRGGGERETERSEGKSITQIQLSEATRS